MGESLSGRVAVVTGATSGIGKEIARGLARRGATVVIGARDLARGEAARAELVADGGNREVSVLALDVADRASVESFAKAVAERHPRLSLLVNNAGAWIAERRESRDGHEMTLATNVLGPHLLSALLLEPLRAGAPSRIVNIVSSFASDYDPTDLEFKRRPYDGVKAYAQSKLALRMLTWGLARRLAGSGVTANAVAPGFVRTDIYNQPSKGLVARAMKLAARWFAAPPAKGADTPIWAATAPELETVTGRLLVGRKIKDPRPSEMAAVAELERLCDQLVGIAPAKA